MRWKPHDGWLGQWYVLSSSPTHGDHHRNHGEWGLLRWNQVYHTVGDHDGDHGLNERVHSDRDHHRDFFASNQSDNSSLVLATPPVQRHCLRHEQNVRRS